MGHEWAQARRHIQRLADQVAAFYALEQQYMRSLHRADPEIGAPGYIQTLMRDSVESLDGFPRPSMTAKQAREIAARYT